MISPIRNFSLRALCLPVISALAVIVAAAAFDPDENWARLRGLPIERRAKLVENLKKFDLLYTRQQQESLRELDRKIHSLPPDERARYLAVLARYHNWLNQLPDAKKDELSGLPASERMAAVKKAAQVYPLRNATTSHYLRTVDLGEYTPFELASLFKIWQAMAPEKRRAIERFQQVFRRHEEMFKAADGMDIPREIKPADFDEESATGLEPAPRRRPPVAKDQRPNRLLNELRKKKDEAHVRILSDISRRLTINQYFVDTPPKSVTAERLAEFLAAFPPWLQSAFDQNSPEEAQRRLAIVYRLVFPPPSEMKPTERPLAPAATAVAPPVTQQKPVGSTRPSGKPTSRSGNSPF